MGLVDLQALAGSSPGGLGPIGICLGYDLAVVYAAPGKTGEDFAWTKPVRLAPSG